MGARQPADDYPAPDFVLDFAQDNLPKQSGANATLRISASVISWANRPSRALPEHPSKSINSALGIAETHRL